MLFITNLYVLDIVDAPAPYMVTRDRRPFLRRTKPTRAPETSTEPIETTTRNLTRGPNRFRNRVQSTTARSDRPTRTYLRRRTGVSAATAVNNTSSATTSSATISSTSASLTSRRTLFVNRRRPGVTTLSPTTTEPLPNEPTVKTTTLSPTAFIESEEVLQEIGEIDYLEDSTQVTTDLPRTTEYVQRRRPLVQLQIKTEDQNLAATTEEEKKRQSKKYSSSFKQNELNEIIRQRTSGEVVEILREGKTNTESYTSETAAAVALAAHQLIAAPVPVTTDYEEDAISTNEPYKYTTAYTITQQSEDMLKTPAYTTSKKYYDPISNTYRSVEVENLSTSTYSTDNTNIRSKQGYTTVGGFSGRSSNSQEVVELPSTVPTYTTNAATKASRRITGRRYRGRTTTTTTDADVISTIQPSTYEPVTDKRGQIKFNGEYVDSFAGFGFGASKTTDVVRQSSGAQRYTSGVNRGSGSRYRINAGVPVTTDSTYEARTTVIRGPEKYKNSASTFESTVDVKSNTGGQSNLDVQTITDERGSEKYSTGKYQDSVATFESNVDVQSNVGVQTDEQSSGRFSTGVNRFRISSEAQVAPTDATYEAKITDIRGPAEYSAGEYQGSVSTLVTNEYAVGAQTNPNVQYNLGAQSNTGERYSTNTQSNVNIEHNMGAQFNSVGLQSVTSTEIKRTDLRGSEKYATGKYQDSISTINAEVQSNTQVQYDVGAQSNTGAWANTDAHYNVNKEYDSNGKVNTGQSVTSTKVKTTDVRGSEKYQGSISTNADIQSTAGAQYNTGAWVNTDAQYNVNKEHNSNGQVNTGQSVASTEVKTTDIRGSDKYQGSISTIADIQSTAGAQSNTGAWVNTDAQYNVNKEYNSNGQVNTGQSVVSTEVKTTDIRGSDKYSTEKYQGSISTNADIQSTAGAQYNTGAWINTDAQYNVNKKYNSNGQVNTGQSVASTEVKTTDIRGSDKYQGSISTNAQQQSTAGAQSNTGAWVNTDAQYNVNKEYNSNGQVNTGQSVASTEVKTTDIRGLEKYQGSISTNADIQSTAGAQYNTGAWINTDAQYNVNKEHNSNGQANTGQSVAFTEVKTTDIRGSEKYQGSISTNAQQQSTAGAQSNTGKWVTADAQYNVNKEYNSNGQATTGQSVASTEVKTTDIRGSEKYQGSISTNADIQSTAGAQSNTGAWVNTDAQYNVNKVYNSNGQVNTGQSVVSTEVKTTDIRGSDKYSTEKYQGSISTLEANVDVESTSGLQSNASVQYDLGAHSNTGKWVNTNAQSNVTIEHNSNGQTNAGQTVTKTEAKTTDIHGLDNYSTGKYQDSVSTFGSNVDVQSNAGVHLATDEQGSGKYYIGRNRYRISTEAPVTTDSTYEARITDIRGSEEYKSSVSILDTNIDGQSNTGTQSNVGVLTTTDEQSAEKYSVDVNKFTISADASVTATDATYGARTTDIRGSEKYKTSVSNLETNGNVLSNAGVQSNLGLQTTTDEWGSEKYSTETYQSLISLEANKDVQNNANDNNDSQFNTGTQSVTAVEVKTTDISGSEKYSSELNQGSVTNFGNNVSVQSKSGVRFTTDERNSGMYSVRVNRYRITTEAPVTTDSTYESKVTDLRGSEKYKNSASDFESNVNVKSNARTQSNVGARISTDEKGAGKYSVRVNRFRVGSDKPVTTTDATYGARTTDIRGSEKYETLVSNFKTNKGVESHLGVQTVTDERGTEKYSTEKYEVSISFEASKDTQSNAGAKSVTNAEVSTSDLRGSDKYTTGSKQGTISSFETNVNVQSNLGVQLETDEGSSGKYSVNVNRYRINAEAPVTTTSTSYEAKITDVRGSEKYKTLETNFDVKSNAQSQSNAEVQTVSAERSSEKYSTEKYEGSVSTFGTNAEAQSNVQIVNEERRGGKYSIVGNRRRVGVKRFRVTTEAPIQSTDAIYATSTTNMRGSEKYSAGRNKELISTFETNADLEADVNAQYITGAESITPTVPITFGVTTSERRIGVKKVRVTTEAPVLITDATYATSTTAMRGSEKYSAGRNKELISTFETNADLQSDVNVQNNSGAELITPTVTTTFGVKTTNISGSDKYSTRKYEGSAFKANIEIQSNGGFQSVTSPVPIVYEVKTTDQRGPLKYVSGQNQSSILNVETNVDVQSNSGAQSYTHLQNDTTAQSNAGIQYNTNARYNANAQSNTGEFRNNNAQSNINVEYDANTLSNANLAYNVDVQSNTNTEYNTEAGVQSVSSTKIKSTEIRGSDKYSAGKYEGSISTLGANINNIQSNEGIQSVSSQIPIAYEVNTTDNRGPIKYAAQEYQSSVLTFEANSQSNGNAQSNANVQYDSNVQTNGDSYLNTKSNVNIENNARLQSTVDKQTNTNAQFNANAQNNSSTDAHSNTNIDYNASAQANTGAQYNANAQLNINAQYNTGAQSYTGEVKSVISSVPVIYEMKTTDIQSLEKNSSVKNQTSTLETNVDVQSNAGPDYNASVQSDAKIQSNTNGQYISSTVPLSYEINATEIRGPAKYSSGTNKESDTSFQSNVNGQSVSSIRPNSYKIRTKGRRPTKFSGGYRSKVTNVESDADVISTLQPTTYESQTTDIRGETKYSTAEYRDSATRFENTAADGISTIQPTISTYEIKTRGPGKYWTGQYRSRTSSSLQTDEDSISTVQPTTYEVDTTDIRGSSRYSAEEYRGRVSQVQTNTDIPFVSTIQSYESDTFDTRGPIRYSTVNAYADGTYNENTDSDVISNSISTTYAPKIVNTRVPTRFTTASTYRGSTVQTDTEIPSTVSTITEYSFDSTLGKSASRSSQTGYRGRYSNEAEISERTSGRTDVRQPTRLITGSYSGRGTRPTIASESIDSQTVSSGSSEATQERGAAKYYVTSDITDIREPAQFSSSLDLRGSARFTGSEILTGRTIRPGFLPQNTIDPILSGITINIGAEKGDSTARYNSATDGSATTLSASEYESRKSSQSATNVVSSGDALSINIGESTATTANPSTVKSARPTGFTPSLLNLGEIAEEKSSLKYQISQKSNSYQGNERGTSTARYEENEKIPVPVIYAYSSSGSSSSQSSSQSSSAEPSYFTREYLLESPVTKTYEEEYQYLSPVTIPSTTGRKSIRRKIYRKYNAQKPVENVSTTTTTEAPSSSTEAITPKRRTTTVKPFQKLTVRRVPLQSVQKITLSKKEIEEAKQRFKPAKDYDYYDDNHEKIAKYDGTKVIVRGEGNIQCLDIGNFPHPTSCKKFISCARIESGAVLGWEYICPKGLSFDPVGGICNWSAGLGCNEKDI